VATPDRDGQSSRLETVRDQSQPVETSPGAVSHAELADAVVAAVSEKRWAIAESLAAEMQRRKRDRTPINVVPLERAKRRR
jgi:hypothetical protein